MENIKIPTVITDDVDIKDDYVLIDEDTMDLSNVIEQTQKININGDINE